MINIIIQKKTNQFYSHLYNNNNIIMIPLVNQSIECLFFLFAFLLSLIIIDFLQKKNKKNEEPLF